MPALLGRSKPMREVVRLVEKVAPSDTTVLILGESGTGKELIARALHVLSPRARGPFVAINCAAIPETLLENELFGHEKGAYTGANAKAIGKVEAADKGTLFLDEIGEMPLPLQAKILRLLQDKTYDRIGGTKTRRADIRIIAATNRDLKEQVAARRFREDLYYRLSVVPITLPALRERPEDIPLLAQVVLERQAEALGRPGLRFSPEALERIVAYRWPGNVRELENEIERAAVLAHGDVIEAGDLELSARVADPDLAALARLVPLEGSLEDVLARLSSRAARILAAAAVDTAGGDRARAAANLGISVERLESLLASV
ncbi:MAG: AAA family ATPase [Acidobacteria bacterium]|nr:MAG: AAA family ATPase [Acidobacteriota bacterium]